MMVKFPWWGLFGIFDVYFWYLTVPVLVGLVLLGRSPVVVPALRVAATAVAIVLALPFLIAGVLAVHDWADLRARDRTLAHAETMFGLALPAGTRIYLEDRAQQGFRLIDLPSPVSAGSAMVTGELKWDPMFGGRWDATLADDQRVDGWPCRAGAVRFDQNWTVQECVLSTTHALFGLALPAGTRVSRGDAKQVWQFNLPADAGVAIPSLTARVPPGAEVWMRGDGRLVHILNATPQQPIIVHGVPLNKIDDLTPRGDRAVGELWGPVLVAGEMRPTGTAVCIDLGNGSLSLALKNSGVSWLYECPAG